MHLCEACAAASGLDGTKPISITDVLLGLGGKKVAAAETSRKICPRCQMRFTDFKKTSRLGCQACYEAFAEELAPLLESMQKGREHIGKKPARLPAPDPLTAQLAELKAALAAAVKAENYEEAARLRDQIQACSGKLAANSTTKPT
jgi:protein arginine kinase activator